MNNLNEYFTYSRVVPIIYLCFIRSKGVQLRREVVEFVISLVSIRRDIGKNYRVVAKLKHKLSTQISTSGNEGRGGHIYFACR